MKFLNLLPAQAQSYRGIFRGRDVILHSKTGTGKTFAYSIPIIERQLICHRETYFNSTTTSLDGSKNRPLPTPFLLIFTLNNELAAQCKTVLQSLYGSRDICIAIAGFDDLSVFPQIHILIGSVLSLNTVIRGEHAPRSGRASRKQGKARRRIEATTPSLDTSKGPKDQHNEDGGEEDSDDEASINAEVSDNEEEEETAKEKPTVDVSCVQAIVVDEVDLTLGPRFSTIGKRMKVLLNYIRKHNGAMSPQLRGADFRSHHYVLCGATIPNWVLKAGFLGLKKFYYNLFETGDLKLPEQLVCFKHRVVSEEAEEKVCEVPRDQATFDLVHRIIQGKFSVLLDEVLGRPPRRIIVFGNTHEIKLLATKLQEFFVQTPEPSTKPTAKEKHHPTVVVRCIHRECDELERIASIENFNASSSASGSSDRWELLLCTDLAARGVDFVRVDIVVIMSLPPSVMSSEVFVHRAGRAARVGQTGACIVLNSAPPLEGQRINHRSASISNDQLRQLESTTHVSFRFLSENASGGNAKLKSSKKNENSSVMKFQLCLRNPFQNSGKTKNSSQPWNANDTLAQALGQELFSLVTEITPVTQKESESTIQFKFPVHSAHLLRKRLWKYDLTECVS